MPWHEDIIVDSNLCTVRIVDRSNGINRSKACTEALQKTINAAIDADIFPILHREHSELYPIIGADFPVLFERYAAPLFGVTSRGAHMIAYVTGRTGMRIWVPRRSKHLFTYPGKLDSSVAGGVKAEQSIFGCIVSEAEEEASLGAGYVRENARAAGVVTYSTRNQQYGLVHSTVIYVHDIELPEKMVLQPNDDEVSEFCLLSTDEVRAAIRREEFKPNSAMVMIDFLMRHGVITPETENDYAEIAMALRRKLPVAMKPQNSKSA